MISVFSSVMEDINNSAKGNTIKIVSSASTTLQRIWYLLFSLVFNIILSQPPFP